jgi:hypothetical protein
MVTPVIIKILFWIGVAISIIAGIIVFLGGIIGVINGMGGPGELLLSIIGAPIVMALGVLSTRIYAELLILAFRINETLTEIKNLLER